MHTHIWEIFCLSLLACAKCLPLQQIYFLDGGVRLRNKQEKEPTEFVYIKIIKCSSGISPTKNIHTLRFVARVMGISGIKQEANAIYLFVHNSRMKKARRRCNVTLNLFPCASTYAGEHVHVCCMHYQINMSKPLKNIDHTYVKHMEVITIYA